MQEEITFTSISEIYDNFLSKISNHKYLSIPEEDIEEEFFGYFKTARAKFYRCKNNLETEIDDSGDMVIKSRLTDFEIEVLTFLMLVEYLMPIVIANDKLSQLLSDKDFKVHSQANQLREVRLLHKSCASTAKKMITEYTYLDLEEEKM